MKYLLIIILFLCSCTKYKVRMMSDNAKLVVAGSDHYNIGDTVRIAAKGDFDNYHQISLSSYRDNTGIIIEKIK